MPLLAAQRICNTAERPNPCRRGGEQCARCEALTHLTDDDWYLIGFYRSVQDQYINQTPMGGGKDMPPITTPRLEGYEAALRLNGYPRALWPWLTHWAAQLHRFHRKMEELPKTDAQRAHMRSLGVE